MRVLVVFLPMFRLERCGYTPDDLAGLIAEEKSAMRLQALTTAAAQEGLRSFMTATEARALVPEIELVELDADGEARDLQSLVRAFDPLSDRVRAPWIDTLLLEVGSTSCHFGGEAGIVEAARRLAARLGHTARVVLTDDPTAGRALAREGVEGVVPAGEAAGALAPLPVRSLAPSRDVLDALRAVGVSTIRSFAALSGPSVAARFGEEGAHLHAIARGGVVPGLVDWAEPEAAERRVKVAMGGATSTLQLHFVLPGLLVQLAQRLGRRGEAVVRLRISMHLEPTVGVPPVVAVSVRVGRPTRSPRILEPIVRVRLEGVRLEAPVDELVLEAVEVAAEQGWQPGLTDRTEATEPLPDLLARLADHLGGEALCGVEPVDVWCPERAWRPGPWPVQRLFAGPQLSVVDADDPVVVQQAHERPGMLPRPTLLLPSPRPIEVSLDAAGHPVRVRRPEGWARVRRAEGPERLRSDWWSDEDWARDYWAADLDDGRGSTRWWIFATPEGVWFHHGYFD